MNIRNLLMLSAVGLGCAAAMAVPARQELRSVTQADGSVISLRLMGDEFFHSFVTEDGLAVERLDDGNFHYRNAEGVSGVIAHNPAMRDASEAAFLKSNAPGLGFESLVRASNDRISARRASARRSAAPQKASQVPQNGSPRIPVLLVQYKDYRFKDADPNTVFTEFFSEGDTSAFTYFKDQSNGKFTPQFDVYGPFTLSSNRTTYGGNDASGNDKGVGKMVAEGCQGLDSQIDFSRYDNDGDGECDVVIVLYAGDGEASSYDKNAANAVWPCQWDLASSDYGRNLTLDRTRITRFAVFNELNGSNLKKIDGIGTFCHEFSHCLDLPDFYDTNYGGHFGMAHWSLMDYGCYNDDGYTPVGYTAYEKEFMGWIEIEEGKENTHYDLPVFNSGSIESDRAVKLTNDRDRNEYYILENRAKQGWDRYMPGEGLFIYHVTYSKSAWTNNTVNDYDLQRMTPVPADNSLKMNSSGQIVESDLAGDLWPYGSSVELTDDSTPAAKVNTGSKLGKPVTEITRNPDGTIGFWVMKAPVAPVAQPSGLTVNVEDASSATFYWEPGDDADVTYTLEIKEHKEVTYELVISTVFDSNNHGWETVGFVDYESADGGLRFGSNKNIGGIDSPLFEVAEDGLVTVIFDAKYYNKDGSSVEVNLLDNKGYVKDTETVPLTASYATYALLLEGVPGTQMAIEFATTDTKKRFYLKRADIYTGDATALATASPVAYLPAEKGDDLFRTITGITGTSYTVSGLRPNTLFDYRMKAVANDTDNFGDSDWTDYKSFEMITSLITGIAEAGADVNAEYYNLQGIRVNENSLTDGIYIVRKGNHTSKVLIHRTR